MQLAREWLGRSGWHSMAIKIPVSRKGKGDVKGNRLYETINIPDGVDERSAEQLMKGNTKNNFFNKQTKKIFLITRNPKVNETPA